MAFKVFDDFIDEGYRDLVENMMLNTHWMYQKHMDYDNDKVLVDGADSYSQFSSVIFHHGSVSNNHLHGILLPMVSKVINEELKGYDLARSRAILQVPNVARPEMYVPHIDFDSRYIMSVIYYACDSDGDTVLFEESGFDVSMEDRGEHSFKEVDRVSPKKGRLVIFPSDEYHCGSPPSKSNRMLVNFNFERNA